MKGGDPQHFQRSLQFAVFAVQAVQCVKHDVDLVFLQLLDKMGRVKVNANHVVVFLLQRRDNCLAGVQGNFPLG